MTHRPWQPPLTANMTGKIDPDYQAEVDRHTESLEVAYAAEQRRLEKAEARHRRIVEAAVKDKTKRDRVRRDREIKVAWELVELRREELLRLATLMASAPQSATHRGGRSYRPVPVRHGGNF